MAKRRKRYESSFKAKVALEALQERETVDQTAQRFSVHPAQVHQWKRKLLEEAAAVFDREGGARPAEAFEATELSAQIRRLELELDWLQKKAAQFGE